MRPPRRWLKPARSTIRAAWWTVIMSPPADRAEPPRPVAAGQGLAFGITGEVVEGRVIRGVEFCPLSVLCRTSLREAGEFLLLATSLYDDHAAGLYGDAPARAR